MHPPARSCILALAASLIAAAAVPAAEPDAPADIRVIVDESGYWRTWLDFFPDQIDPEVAKASLDDHLSERAQERMQDEVLILAGSMGVAVDAPGFDWRDHLYILWEPYISSYSPLTPSLNNEWGMASDTDRLTGQTMIAPPVASDWMDADFDATGWVARPAPAQMGDPAEADSNKLGHLQPATTYVRAAYYRTAFDADPQHRYLLDITYRGGLRVFLNGQEVARQHLPDGPIDAHSRAQGYDRVYEPGKRTRGHDTGTWMNRTLKALELPSTLLEPGVNVLAIETRAPYMHPQALTVERRVGRGRDRHREFVVAPAHTGIQAVALRTNAAAGADGGLIVWTPGPHHRVHDVDRTPAGAVVEPMRFVGPRNGRFAAQFVLHSAATIDGLAFEVEPLQGGAGVIGVESVSLAAMLPRPADAATFKFMGDHRGGPSAGPFDAMSRWRYRDADFKSAHFYDEIGQAPPTSLEADKAQPVWVVVDFGPEQPAGRYEGAVIVRAGAQEPIRVPLIAEVIDWQLPNPGDFVTDVWIEQSPYGVAASAKVDLWSAEHFALIDQSFAHLAKAGTDFVHIPVLQFTEFGNQADAPIRWTLANGKLRADFTILDRYLDVALKHLGAPRIISFGLMQGAGGAKRGSDIMRNVTTIPLAGGGEVDLSARPELYQQVARAIYEHMRNRGLADVMFWGLPWDFPPEPELPDLIAEAAPGVGWVRAGHCDLGTPAWVAAQSEVWPSWKNRPAGVVNVLNPRRHSPFHMMEGYYPPFTFRLLPIRAARNGYTGIGRIGGDHGRTWGEGNKPSGAMPDFGIKNLLWVRDGRVHDSQRLQVLREGLQEDQAWRYLRDTAESGRLPDDLAAHVRRVLENYISQTAYVQAMYFSFTNPTMQDHSQNWQPRSRELYELAARVSDTLEKGGR